MKSVVPTITESTAEGFFRQLEVLSSFAHRLHLDFSDGVFSPVKMMNLVQADWPDELTIDLHLMYQAPNDHLETVISLQPSTAIIHAEADGDLLLFLNSCKQAGITPGVALLPQTQVEMAAELIHAAEYVLVFGGKLGYQGGELDKNQIAKIKHVLSLNPVVTIGWDGGINADNIENLAQAGVGVFNVGSAVSHAVDPALAYQELTQLVQN